MWNCQKCGEQVEESFDLCWSCGTTREGIEDSHFNENEAIVNEEDLAQQRQARVDESLVQAGSFPTAQLAYLFKDRLQAEGIPACVDDEQTVLNDWLLQGAMGGIKILVLENDLPKARRMFHRMEREVRDRDKRHARDDKPQKPDDYGIDAEGREPGDESFWRKR